MKTFIAKRVSPRTGNEYTALYVNINGVDIITTLDKVCMFRILKQIGKSERDYYLLEVGDEIVIG